MGNPLKTSVYIDGFNLYYGALKQTPYKWLDIGKLCQVMLPAHVITPSNSSRRTLLTNDSDLTEPVKVIRQVLNLPIGI